MTTRIHAFLFAAICLVVLAITVVPVQAEANTPISGDCWLVGDPDENGPKFRWWFSGNDNLHLRDDSQVMTCDFDDNRLDGLSTFYSNWDVKLDYTSPVWVVGHDHGYGYVYDETGAFVWEFTYSLHFKPDGALEQIVVWHGVGPYKGLIARTRVTTTLFDFPYLHYEGIMTDTGK